MSDLEMSQVRIQLTKDPDTLEALRLRKQFRKDLKGEEFIPAVFNSTEIRFHKGEVKTLGKVVAESIFRRSFVIVGKNPDGSLDDLTGETRPIFDVVEEYNLGDQVSTKNDSFMCPVCRKTHETPSALGYHLTKAHAGKKTDEVDTDTEETEEEVETAVAE